MYSWHEKITRSVNLQGGSMADIRELTGKTVTTLREEGIVAVAKKAKNLVQMSVIEGKDA